MSFPGKSFYWTRPEPVSLSCPPPPDSTTLAISGADFVVVAADYPGIQLYDLLDKVDHPLRPQRQRKGSRRRRGLPERPLLALGAHRTAHRRVQRAHRAQER